MKGRFNVHTELQFPGFQPFDKVPHAFFNIRRGRRLFKLRLNSIRKDLGCLFDCRLTIHTIDDFNCFPIHIQPNEHANLLDILHR